MMRARHAAVAAFLLSVPTGTAISQGHAQHHGAAPEKLGTVHFATSCSRAVAPRFDRAVALLHSFEFGASIRYHALDGARRAAAAAGDRAAAERYAAQLKALTVPSRPGRG